MSVSFSFTISKTNANDTVEITANKTHSHLVDGLIFLLKIMKKSEASRQARPTKYKTMLTGLPPLVTDMKVKIENKELDANKMPAAQNGANASR